MQFLEKTMETCSNIEEKKLFSVRTKLSYCKVFHRKCSSSGNEKKLRC